MLDRASELDPKEMRSLDAVHLGAALTIGSDLGVFVTYDKRLGEAHHGQCAGVIARI